MDGIMTGPYIHIGRTPGRMTTQSDPRSAWGRVVAIKLSHSASNSQWLDNLIISIKLIKDASGLAPFPYLGWAAGITMDILQIIQVNH